MQMSIERVLLLGGGGHGLVVAEALSLSRPDIGVVFGEPNAARRVYLAKAGYVCLAADDESAMVASGAEHFHVAVGSLHEGVRATLFDRAERAGLHPLTIIHPSAVVAPSAVIGAGCFVGPGAIVHTGARVGRNCIVNSRAVLEHDVDLGEGSHVAPGAIICGGVHIGAEAMVGAGAVVREMLTVGDRAVVGLGAVVVCSVAENSIVVGNPAKPRPAMAPPPSGASSESRS